MLWKKAWLETRWRFVIGLGLLVLMAAGIVFDYPAVAKLLPVTGTIDETSGAIGRVIREAVELQRDYRGFVWYQWHRQNLTNVWTLFAVLLGAGGLLSNASGSAALFTLSLPASRTRVLGIRMATAVAELLGLAIVPSLVISLLSRSIGQSYPATDAVVHGVCLFIAGAAFFSLALLLSTIFDDPWRPMGIACAVAVAMAFVEVAVRARFPYGLFRVMSAEAYFRGGHLPWPGLLASAAASLAMLHVAAINFSRRDF